MWIIGILTSFKFLCWKCSSLWIYSAWWIIATKKKVKPDNANWRSEDARSVCLILNIRPRLRFPIRYLNIHLIAVRWTSLGSYWNLHIDKHWTL